MILVTYLIKSLLLMTGLWLLYKLLLESEKMHRFNRFFLLFALTFGLSAPLITFEVSPDTRMGSLSVYEVQQVINKPADLVAETVEPWVSPSRVRPAAPQSAVIDTAPQQAVPLSENPQSLPPNEEAGTSWFSFINVIIALYIMVTFLLLLRFGFGLLEIRRKIGEGKKVYADGAHLVLLEENITPQSFFKYIFLNQESFESGEVGEEILQHELTHVRHWHSLDVLVAEFLKVIFWFNPLIYFFKHSIQLNHEFQADDYVVSKVSDVSTYQQLLLKACGEPAESKVTSSLLFGLAKKRFGMMGRRSHWVNRISRKALLMPVLLALAVTFCTEKGEPEERFFYTPELTVEVLSEEWPRVEFFSNADGYPYTGMRKRYSNRTGEYLNDQYIEDGFLKAYIRYDEAGNEFHRMEYEYVNDELFSIRSIVQGVLLGETLFPTSQNDGINTYRQYHPNGQLRYQHQTKGYVREHPPMPAYQGLMTLYDKEGNILEQELYKDGELVEKIK